MSTAIAGLHKILKDETRRKIILQLNDKGAQSYTELLEATGAGSTGRLNYHLKILSDLLTKNEAGQYTLSEKGKVAVKLIAEFPEDSNQAAKFRNQKLLLAIAAFGNFLYLAIILAFYAAGQLELYRLATGVSASAVGMVFLVIIYRVQKSASLPGADEEAVHMRLGYVCGGVGLFLLVGFFGVGVVFRVVSDFLGWRFTMGNPLYETLWNPVYMLFSMLILPAFGGILFYYLGKSKKFRRPKWAVWLRSHF
ncbi:MAG: winged helix-turn-helix domain-containing protein [Candidatus Bathyarchaeia archaeon]|jgi:DNA-binding transcriptional ArsR family regulator